MVDTCLAPERQGINLSVFGGRTCEITSTFRLTQFWLRTYCRSLFVESTSTISCMRFWVTQSRRAANMHDSCRGHRAALLIESTAHRPANPTPLTGAGDTGAPHRPLTRAEAIRLSGRPCRHALNGVYAADQTPLQVPSSTHPTPFYAHGKVNAHDMLPSL